MSAWHVVLDGSLQPRWLPRLPGKIMVMQDGEGNRGIGHAGAVHGPSGLVVSMDDATFLDSCNHGDDDDWYDEPHSHRNTITQGSTPYARPLVTKTQTGWAVVAVVLTGMDHESGNEFELRPGTKPAAPTIPPAPEVNLEPIPSLWH